jgi:hypothetical protein
MAKLAQTIREARDHILKRLNSLNITSYEDLVLETMNHAMLDVVNMHNWQFLRKRSTFTTTDATGVVEMPEDLDRVMVIHQDGSYYYLAELDPLRLEQAKEDISISVPMFYCVRGYAQDTSAEAPNLEVELCAAPAAGEEFVLWYIKTIDEFTSATLDTVPMIPPNIWEIIIKKATLELLKVQESPPASVAQEERHLMMTIDMLKKREHRSTSRRTTFGMDERIMNHFATRGLV